MAELNLFSLHPVGMVRSGLLDRGVAPRQGHEGAPDAWLEIEPCFLDALDGIALNSQILVLTWLHLSDRNVLKVHPRRELSNALRGVFATRSPDRPNPIGLHTTTVLEIDPQRGIRVAAMEAIDGTPVIDIKPALAC